MIAKDRNMPRICSAATLACVSSLRWTLFCGNQLNITVPEGNKFLLQQRHELFWRVCASDIIKIST